MIPDVMKGTILWPLVTIFSYLRFLLAFVLSLPYLLFCLIALKNPLNDFENFYSSLSRYSLLGKYIFSGLIGLYVPYTGSISPVVEELSKGMCRVVMEDYPWLRNSFSSLHAVALTNLGEAVGGIAVFAALQKQKHLRAIPVAITTTFIAKARGRILGTTQIDRDLSEGEIKLVSSLHDFRGTLVATVSVTWKISLRGNLKEKTR